MRRRGPGPLAGVVVWVAARLVPVAARARFIEEWQGELEHVADRASRLRAVRVSLGSVADALAWRRLAGESRSRAGRLDGAVRDARLAFRALARTPGFALFALLSLGVGIGANAAMFAVVKDALVSPLPYPESERLVRVYEARPEQGRDRNVVSYPDFLDWQAQSTVFEGMAAYRYRGSANLGVSDGVVRVRVAQVSAGFFDVIGMRPFLGRGLAADDDVPGAARVVVLGHGLWQSAFGGDTGVIGRPVRVNGEPYTVVGVLDERPAFPPETQLWQPLALDPATEFRGSHSLDVVARLAPGVTIDRASSDLRQIASRLEAAYPDVNAGHTTQVFRLRDELVAGRRAMLLVLSGGLGLLLLIVCANLASLQITRASRRRGELVLRSVMGATRGRLVSQLVVESAILGLAGGGLAIVAAMPILRLLGDRVTEALPWLEPPGLDAPTVAFVVVASLIAVGVTGLVPALRVSRSAAARVLAEDRRGTASRATRRTRSALVIAEFALAVLLLVGAGLTARTLQFLSAVDPGFDTGNVLTAELWLSDVRYASDDARRAVYGRVMDRVRALPGVSAVGATFMAPLSGMDGGRNFRIEGRPEPTGPDEYNARFRIASGSYFEAAGIPLLSGRVFRDTDVPHGTLVAVINDAMRRAYWPDLDPLGARIFLGTTPIDVVGVVGDVLHEGPRSAVRPEFYLNMTQVPTDLATLFVRTDRDPAMIASRVRSAIAEVESGVPVTGVEPVATRVRAAVGDSRALAALTGTFAFFALLLATLGTYGVMSYSVGQRTREIGVRMAIGGDPSTVRAMVLRDGLRLIAFALPLGLAGASMLARTMSHVLFGVAPTDLPTFAGAAALIILVALAATLGPAVRATRIDPMVALRE